MAEVEVPSWLKGLPLAPEYHPTEAEFLDPIDYIFKIEQEASQYGICKIVPPYLKAPKRVVFNNLNLSLANSRDGPCGSGQGSTAAVGRNMCPARSMNGSMTGASVGVEVEAGGKAKFTTRRQQLGWNARRARAGLPQAVVHKLVWQSGESYTLDQFEAKAKMFARNRLGTSQEVVPTAVEALFWKAALEKAISIEYANDIPGSAFAEPRETTMHPSFASHKRRGGLDEVLPTDPVAEYGSGQEEDEKVAFDEELGCSGDEADVLRGSDVEASADNVRGISCKLSNSAWNMRKVARSPGSLLRFIPDEVPGVTSPMVYIGMLFSWFAWHVEDHELHSLNYLHTGAPKTWYAVPGDAAEALEEVVRVHGYGGQLNGRDAFARLGEKTTVMSPEVLVAAGVPCCRLVQNAGEYVVTFPRAYHLGFSHGFNCGEAANFATPGWLDVAREASVRRAAMNYLPMLSHQQLLYMLAVSLISRSIFEIGYEKRSSRLKEKKRVGEEVVKSMFVSDVIQQNDLIGKLLDKGVASCLLVKDLKHCAPRPVTAISDWNFSSITCKQEAEKQEHASKNDTVENSLKEGPIEIEVVPSSVLISMASKVSYLEQNESGEPCVPYDLTSTTTRERICGDDLVTSPMPLDLSTLPCAACGILCYTGMAVVQPSQIAATLFRPLQSHVSGAGSHPAKGAVNSSSGALPGKADKKSADFHMLPTVGVQPLLEPEEATADVYADGLYEDQSGEPEVWTPDLEECPTNNKDGSNGVTLDVEVPHIGPALATLEKNEAFFSEVVNAVACAGNTGAITNKSAGEFKEVDTQNLKVVTGLRPGVSVDSSKQLTSVVAGGVECGRNTSEMKQAMDGTLSSLQLLAAAYDSDSDMDEDNEKEEGAGVMDVGSPFPGPTRHVDSLNFSGGALWKQVAQSSCLAGCHSSVPTPRQNSKVISSGSSLKHTEPSQILSVVMFPQLSSQDSAADTADMSVAESPEERLDAGTGMNDYETSPEALKSSGRTLDELKDCTRGITDDDREVVTKDETEKNRALPLGECVTCSLPHDSFFDSFEEVIPKITDHGNLDMENSSEKIDALVSCGNGPKSQALTASGSVLDPNGSINRACTSIVKADTQLPEGSSITSDICSVKLGEAVDRCSSQTAGCSVKYPTADGNEESCGLVESFQIEQTVSTQLQIFKGAARPRMLCLEHAVVAQKRLDSIGGGTVILICHSSFPKIEQQAKEVAAEIGSAHQWRTVPFKRAGDEDYRVISAAVQAEEESLPGDSDWVAQLGLCIHGQDKCLSNNIDTTNGIHSSEESEEPAGKGRKLKEKKYSIIRQWCGKGWRSDQLHPLLGGCRDVTAQVDNTILPANVSTSGGVSTMLENGRSRKVMRPARLAEYTPDGRAPKGEPDTKKASKKRKSLFDPAVDNSEEELDEQISQVTPSTLGGSHDGSLAQPAVYGSIDDSLWREVPIASTDSFLLPHLSGAGMAAERGGDDFLSITPQSLYSVAQEMRLAASEAPTSPDGACHHEASQSCCVVGGFLQRGAKLQALQKLCRQLSTPVSVPCTPLTTPIRFASRVKPSHKRISTAKLVNRLKRKPTTQFSPNVKKQKFAGETQHNRSMPSLCRGINSGSPETGGDPVNALFVAKCDNLLKTREQVRDDPRLENYTACGNDGQLRTDLSNTFETHTGEEVKQDLEEVREQLHESALRPVQEWNRRNLEDSNLSSNKGLLQRGDTEFEDIPDATHRSSDKLSPQTPNIHSTSISFYCTESLPQGPVEQSKQEPGLPSVGETSKLHDEAILVPRISRVRGKRIKSREWKNCIQISATEQDEENVSQTWDENRTGGDVSKDLNVPENNISLKGCGSEVQAHPDFFPYSNCLTGSTSVRRRRVCTPGMAEWGAGKKGHGEAGGTGSHPNVQQDTKNNKRKKSQKTSANKRCDDLEGEFQCDMEGCIMAFDSIRDLQLHKKNLCTWKGCGKHFHMHKYLLQHRRVHLDDRPLKCPWKGCTQAFKWAWARTEHIRVHTGERPYKCMVSGCGQTFRFVSDFSRHKRNTGHRPT